MSANGTAAPEGPKEFAFKPEYLERAKHIIAKYPPGKQASAVMPLLDLAQRQNDNWLPRVAMDYVAEQYKNTTNPGLGRTAEQVARFFGDWPLLTPGLVPVPAWR